MKDLDVRNSFGKKYSWLQMEELKMSPLEQGLQVVFFSFRPFRVNARAKNAHKKVIYEPLLILAAAGD